MKKYIFNKALNYVLNYFIDFYLDHHLTRVKSVYMKKVLIRRLKDEVVIKDSIAHIDLDSKPKIITFQNKVFRSRAIAYLCEFINDNATDAIRHEFAHLKYPDHNKKHSNWTKDIKLFKCPK